MKNKKVCLLTFATIAMACLFQKEAYAASSMNLEQLQQKFPDGAYWNHVTQNGHGYSNSYSDYGVCNNPDGYTWTPCDTHLGTAGVGGHDCNTYNNAMQCHGFALKLGYDAYGTDVRKWTQVYNLSNLKAGDIIRYKYDQHTIFVTDVNGDTVTYGDCNWDGRCKIKWNKTATKSDIASTLTYVYSAPEELSKSSGTSVDNSDAHELRAKLLQVQANGFYTGTYTEQGQCEGYANRVCEALFGTQPVHGSDWVFSGAADGVVETAENLKNCLCVGDYIRFRNGVNYDHSIVITDIDGYTVYYTDANYDGQNSIRWNVSMTMQELADKINQALIWNKYNSYVSGYLNGYGYYGCILHYKYNNVKSLSNIVPTNPQSSKNQDAYDLEDTIEITAYAEGATGYWMSMYKDGGLVKDQGIVDGKFTMSASEYGVGNYVAYLSCWNEAGSIDIPFITFSVVDNSTPEYSITDVFYDVETTDWFVDSVQFVYDNGMMSGDASNFNPSGNMTRAMMVTTLYRLSGSPKVTDYVGTSLFSDVEVDSWYEDAVNWAYNTKITTGYTDSEGNTTHFGSNDNVTREQLAVFLYRYSEMQGYDVTVRAELLNYVGYSEISDYATEAMQWAVGVGLISGVESMVDGVTSYDLSPKGSATRAQLATILMRFCGYYEI